MSAVLDTCALLHWSLSDYAPPTDVLADDLLICAVSWCEIAWKHRLGSLALPGGYHGWQGLVDRLGLRTIAVDRQLFLAAVFLDWEHRDPADRLIVAAAQQQGADLITCDRSMQGYYARCRW